MIGAPRLGFNKYEIRGNITAIFLENTKGVKLETLIDTEDLERIKALGYHWHLRYAKKTKSYYARTTTEYSYNSKGNYAQGGLYLQVAIMGNNYLHNQYVHHKTHDTLDNRKENLEIVTMEDNSKHRKDKNNNNKSGYRNVSWNGHRWVVQLQVNGKNTILGKFKKDQLEEAGRFAEEKRKEIYKEYAGKG